MAPRRIRRQLVSQRSVQDGGMALSCALEIFSDRAARDLCEDRAQELGREPPTRIGRRNWIQRHVGYSWMRCLSSQTRNAASKRAFVRVSVPAAAMVVPTSLPDCAPCAFLPFRPRFRFRLFPLVFLTRRVADSPTTT